MKILISSILLLVFILVSIFFFRQYDEEKTPTQDLVTGQTPLIKDKSLKVFPVSTFTSTATAIPQVTRLPPTFTPIPTNTPSATNWPTITPSYTMMPTSTPTFLPSQTPVPTNTHTRVPTPFPQPVNITYGRIYRGSSINSDGDHKAHHAVDGHTDTWWSANAYPPGWWEIDFGAFYWITRVELVVQQTPGSYRTVHNLFRMDKSGKLEYFHTFDQNTQTGQTLAADFTPGMVLAYGMRIETADSESWPAWAEVRIMGLSAQGQDPLSYVIVNTGSYSYANLRSGPGVEYNVIAKVSNGARLKVITQSRGWFQIKIPDSNTTAWIAGTIVDIEGNEYMSATPSVSQSHSAPTAVPQPTTIHRIPLAIESVSTHNRRWLGGTNKNWAFDFYVRFRGGEPPFSISVNEIAAITVNKREGGMVITYGCGTDFVGVARVRSSDGQTATQKMYVSQVVCAR